MHVLETYDFFNSTFLKCVELISVSGYINFAMHNPAGTDITVAVSKWIGLAPNDMYAAIAVPSIIYNMLMNFIIKAKSLK